jgi:hypothetical protein
MEVVVFEVYERMQGVVNGALDTMDIGVLHAAGLSLFQGLALIAIAWAGISYVLQPADTEKGNAVIGKVVRQMIFIGIVYWLLDSGFETVFVQGIDWSLQKIALIIMPSSGDTSLVGGMDFMWASMQAVGQLIAQLFEGAQVWDVLTIAGKNMPTLIVLTLSLFIQALSAMVYAAFLIVSLFLVKLVLMLGPIFIPWLVLEKTDFLFWGWLRFLIVASLYQVVGAAILYFAYKLLAGEAAIIAEMNGSFPESLIIAVMGASLHLAILYLIVQIPKISQALVSGSLGQLKYT